MKKRTLFLSVILTSVLMAGGANAYSVLSSKELGKLDAKNQNVVVKCTTDMGKISNQTCTLRRYAKCTGDDMAKKCNGWLPWTDLRNPDSAYPSWQSGAANCCREMGLR